MKEIVLWKNNRKIAYAHKEIFCLTFLTTERSVWYMIPLMLKTYFKFKKIFPRLTFYSLSFIIDKKRVHFFNLKMSLVPPFLLKNACMKLELDKFGSRIADIDIYTYNRLTSQLVGKISRKTMFFV
jgi:hypothetical protein